jgi:rhodanese-related sulfurtransferase
VALLLRRRGILRIRPLAGGLEGWRQHGYPLAESGNEAAAAKPR